MFRKEKKKDSGVTSRIEELLLPCRLGNVKKRASKPNGLGTMHYEGEGKPMGEQIRLHSRVLLCSCMGVSEDKLNLDYT